MSARRARKRGVAAVVFALVLIVLIGFVALVVDVGHFWQVKVELQNAADSAALAAVRDLNGDSAKFGTALASAQSYCAAHDANEAPVNLPAADVVLGNWDFSNKTFTPMLTPAALVNAVQVTTRRTAATGDPVATFFAPVLGITEQDVTATAIAVGGTPLSACMFALAVPDCSLYDAAGNLRCNAELVFNTLNDNVAFTLGTTTNPNTPAIECAFARAVGYPTCPSNCDCTNACVPGGSGQIRIANGNNFSADMIQYVSWAIANNPGGLYMQLPVVKTGLTANCVKYPLSNMQSVVGYVTIRVTGATGAPEKQIQSTIDCTHSSAELPGGSFYGYTSTNVYLAR